MKTKVQKWGNGLAVRIPSTIAVKAGLAVDDELDMEVESGNVILQRSAKYRLKDLINAITDENLHGAVDTGKPAAGEAL